MTQYILSFLSRSQSSFERNDYNNTSSRFSQNSNNRNNFDKDASRTYLIHGSEVSRLIGRGGLSIKQIQRDFNININIPRDRSDQWIDFTITGANDQVVNDAFHHIQNLVGKVKEKYPENENSYTQTNSINQFQSSNGKFPLSKKTNS